MEEFAPKSDVASPIGLSSTVTGFILTWFVIRKKSRAQQSNPVPDAPAQKPPTQSTIQKL